MMRRALIILCALAALPLFARGASAAEGHKLVVAIPGVPPIFSSVVAYVAQKEGFFKKYGADVELRGFDSGTAGARAAVAGDVDFAISPTPLIISQVANAGVDLVAIYGFPNPDWALGTTDGAKAKCGDLKGQQVGVDTPGGARSIALKQMLVGCHMTLADVQQVPLGSQTAAAMIAGQIKYGVLHLDDVPEIESHGKTVTIVTNLSKTNPDSHYLLGVARRDKLKENRRAYVGLVAGLIEAGRFMSDPKNADAVAQIATVTGRSPAIAKGALKRYLDIGFWAVNDDGMPKNKIEAVTKAMEKIGNIKPGKTPPSYDRLVDASVWRDANALLKKEK
jgi:NitT/TauT family transport system substrate-binding protein